MDALEVYAIDIVVHRSMPLQLQIRVEENEQFLPDIRQPRFDTPVHDDLLAPALDLP